MNGLESLRLSSNPNSFRTAVRLRVYEFVDEAQIRPPLDRPGDFLEPLRRPFGALTGEQLSLGALALDGLVAARVPRLLAQLLEARELGFGRLDFRGHKPSVLNRLTP